MISKKPLLIYTLSAIGIMAIILVIFTSNQSDNYKINKTALYSGMQPSVSVANNRLKSTVNFFIIEPFKIFQFRAPNFSFVPSTRNSLVPRVTDSTPALNTNTPSATSTNIRSLFEGISQNISVPPTQIQNTIQNIINTPTSPSSHVVNVFCTQTVGTMRKTFTGTGILIHSDGTILTNAHVAQFPLVSEKNPSVKCIARSGMNTNQTHSIKTVYVSPKWSETNAPFINTGGTVQTGVYDYALLKIDNRNLSRFGLRPVNLSYETPEIGSSLIVSGFPADILLSKPASNLSFQSHRVSLTKRQRFSSYVGETLNQFDIIETSPSFMGQSGSSGGLISSLSGTMQAMTTIVLASPSGDNNKPIRGITPYHINKDLLEYISGGLESITRNGSQTLETKFAQFDKERLANLFNSYLR